MEAEDCGIQSRLCNIRCIKFFEYSIITLDSEQHIPIGYNLWFITV